MTAHQLAALLLAGPDLPIGGDTVFPRPNHSPYKRGPEPSEVILSIDYGGLDTPAVITTIGKVPVYFYSNQHGTTYLLEAFNGDTWYLAETYWDGNDNEKFGFDPTQVDDDYSRATITKINTFIRAHKNLAS